MGESKNLILTSRLTLLQNSFDRVKGIVETVQKRRQDVARLNETLETTQKKAIGLGRIITSSLYSLSIDDKEGALQNLPRMESALKELWLLLAEVEQKIDAIHSHSDKIGETDKLELVAIDALLKEVTIIAEDFDAVQDELTAAKPTGEIDQLIETGWKKYGKALAKSSPLLIAEYDDFLGGVALRYAGMDLGMCQIADSLARHLGEALQVGWTSLTIPASQAAETMTPARIIRLGFPEWTIWALPLTAHEYGHVVVTEKTQLNRVIAPGRPKQRSQNLADREELAADVVATYAMGPAYACAAILLRLNPLSTYTAPGRQLADAQRAAVILATLNFVDDALPTACPETSGPTLPRHGVGEYQTIIEFLQREWDLAVAQARPGSTAVERERRAKALASWLKQEQESWLCQLWTDLELNSSPIFRPATWSRISEWMPWLLDEQNALALPVAREVNGSTEFAATDRMPWTIGEAPAADAAEEEIAGPDTLETTDGPIHVFNAAWFSRYQEPDKTNLIDRTTRNLLRICQKRDEKMTHTTVANRLGQLGSPRELKGAR